jgi:hypothetical protein
MSGVRATYPKSGCSLVGIFSFGMSDASMEGTLAAVVAELGRCRSRLLLSGDQEGARSLQRAMGHVRRAMRARAPGPPGRDEVDSPSEAPATHPSDADGAEGAQPVPASSRKARRAARRQMRLQDRH